MSLSSLNTWYKKLTQFNPGLITKSARTEGDIEAVFNPQVLSNPKHYCYLTYSTSSDGVEIQREKGKVILKI